MSDENSLHFVNSKLNFLLNTLSNTLFDNIIFKKYISLHFKTISLGHYGKCFVFLHDIFFKIEDISTAFTNNSNKL